MTRPRVGTADVYIPRCRAAYTNLREQPRNGPGPRGRDRSDYADVKHALGDIVNDAVEQVGRDISLFLIQHA